MDCDAQGLPTAAKLGQAIKSLTVQRLVSFEPKKTALLSRYKANVLLLTCCCLAAVASFVAWNCRVPLNVILSYLATTYARDFIVSGWGVLPTTALLWRSIVLNTFSAPRYGNIGGQGLKPMTALCLIAISGERIAPYRGSRLT